VEVAMSKLRAFLSGVLFMGLGLVPVPAQPETQVMNLDRLIEEAARNNPEIQASNKKSAVFSEKAAQAHALEDPMLGLGVVNLPTDFSFQNEDMTMKEISLSQKFPFPGKRPLLKEVADKEAEAVSAEVEETINRVIKDVKTAYFDLSHVYRATGVTRTNKEIRENFVKIADTR
jgi:outer membrane protein TolC